MTAPAPATSRIPTALSLIAPPLVICGAFALATATGWRRWGHLAVDTGRELELPRRMLGSERLYVDLRYYYGPLAPTVNAELYRWFGVHADVLMWAGIASAALATWLVYLLGRRLMGRLGATLSAVAFVFVCAFQRLPGVPAIFNFALPYTFAATYGMIAAMASLLFLVRHVRTRRRRDLLLSVAFLALAGLAKVEPFLPALAAHVAFAAARLREREGRAGLVATYAAGAAALAIVWGALRWRVGSALWAENLSGVLNAASLRFILEAMGLLDAASSLRLVAISAAALACAVGAAIGASRLASASPGARWPPAVAALAPILLFVFFGAFGAPLAFPALPWVIAVATARSFVNWRRRRDDDALVVLLVGTFAFMALARILYRPLPDYYGFYLLPVAIVFASRLLFVELISRVPTPSGAVAARACSMAILLGLTLHSGTRALRALRGGWILLETPRARLMIPRAEAGLLEVVARLRREPAGTRVLALPQGVALVFVAGLEGGDGMFSHLPMEIPDEQADLRLTERWRRSPPDLVLDTTFELREFGSEGFGIDYAQSAAAFLAENYALDTTFASGLRLFRRREAAAGSPGTERPMAPYVR